MTKYLLIAHYDGDHTPVNNLVRQLGQDKNATFNLIVPATPPETRDWTWSEQEAYEVAKRRLDQMMRELQETGANITGEVVNYSVLGAVDEALQKDTYDEIIFGSEPGERARPTLAEMEQHVKQIKPTPIRHVVAEDAKRVERA
jgi:hypothetical protein